MFNLIHSKQSHCEQRKHLSKCFSTAEGHTNVRQVVLDNSFLNTVKISWELVCILQIHTTTSHRGRRDNSIFQLGSIMQKGEEILKFSHKWEEKLIQTEYLREYRG